MLQEQLIPRALYGGALEMDIPVRFEDISDFRPVPDHQEVRVNPCLAQHRIRAGASPASLAGLDRRFLGPITCAGDCGEPTAYLCFGVHGMSKPAALQLSASTGAPSSVRPRLYGAVLQGSC